MRGTQWAGLTDGVIVVSHYICECVRNISTSDNLLGLVGLVTKLVECWYLHETRKDVLTSKNEKMMQPMKSHFAVSKGMAMHPLSFFSAQVSKI